MKHQNLVLTEQAIARHTKRLQKEIKNFNGEIKLSEAQNMLSRILGMKDYHELKKVLKFEDKNPEINLNKSLLEIFEDVDKLRFSIDFVEKNLDDFFKKGNIEMIMEYYRSDHEEIKAYIKENALSLFETASCAKQDFLCNFILEEKLVNLDTLSYEEIDRWFFLLIRSNIKYFEYIFYQLKFPKKLDKELVGKLIHELVNSKNLTSLLKFLKDDRVSLQKDFFYNTVSKTVLKEIDGIKATFPEYDFSYCSLNQACANGDLKMVKYLIEEENIDPLKNGSTVQRACMSGNITLVKYLIEEKNAPYHYYEKEHTHNLQQAIRDKISNIGLDKSTLSSSLISENTDLIKYLIFEKNLNVAEYGNLALQTAFIENSPHYLYFLDFPDCKNYLNNNSQKIFDAIINKHQFIGEKNRTKNNKLQYEIVKYLIENFKIEIKEIPYKSNNPKLINYLGKLNKAPESALYRTS